MAPPRRKVSTRGKKQIYKENAATLRFYRIVALAASAIYVAVNLFLFFDSSTFWTWLLLPMAAAVSWLSLRYMGSMAEATRHPDSGALLFEGTDLNAHDQGTGVAMYLKDVILLTAILQVASTAWCYVWCFWLLVPLRAGYLLWRAWLAVARG